MRSIYQDRLGTKIGKLEQQESFFGVLQAFSSTWCSYQCCSIARPGEKNGLLYIQMLILPRHARDKHMESTQKQTTVLLHRGAAADGVWTQEELQECGWLVLKYKDSRWYFEIVPAPGNISEKNG